MLLSIEVLYFFLQVVPDYFSNAGLNTFAPGDSIEASGLDEMKSMIHQRLEVIEEYITNIEEKLRSLRSLKERAENLKHRDMCPCCSQSLPFLITEKEIQVIDSKIEETQTRLLQMRRESRDQAEKKHKREAEKKNVLVLKAKAFLQENKNLFRKVVRNYYNQAIDDPLEHIRQQQPSPTIWNKAMELYLDSPSRSSLEFEDELFL